MYSLSPWHKIRFVRLADLVVVLGYVLLTVACSLILLARGWQTAYVWFLSIPVFLAALNHYPRPVHISMVFALVVVALWASYQTSTDFGLSLKAIILAGLAVWGFAEVIYRLVATQKQAQEVLRQRNQELAALNAVTATITATLELDQVLQRLVNTVDEVFPQALAATIQLVDEGNETLQTYAASSGTIPVPEKVVFCSGRGVAGLVLAERRLINVADVTSDPRYVPGVMPPSYRSLLVAPLIVGQRVWGTLSVEGEAVGAFEDRDERLVTPLAQQAAIAIENAQLYAETRRRLAETTILQNLSTAIVSLDFEQVSRQAIETLHRLLGIERLDILLPNEDASTLRPVPGGSVGFKADLTGEPVEIPIAQSVSGRVFCTGQSVLLKDASATSDYFVAEDTCSALCVPIPRGDRVIGVLNAESPRPAAFDESDRRLLEAIGAQLAVALDNARLYEETARRLAEVRALAEASTHLTAHLEPEVTLTVLVEQAQTALGADRVAVYLLDRQTDRLQQVYASGLSDEYLDGVRRLYRDLPGYQVLSGEPVWVQDAQADGAVGPMQEWTRREGYHTAVVLPLSHRGRVIGGLGIYFDQCRVRDEVLLDLAQAFANQAAVALENARLFDRIRAAEAQYRGLFEGSTDPIAILSTQGTFLDVNPAACRVLGRTRQDLVGQLAYMVNPQDESQFLQMTKRVLAGEVIRYELGTVVEGAVRHFEAFVERIDYADGPALQWGARDVTARRELDHWREELTGITVHNLRNPLTWVKTGAEMVRMFLPADIDADVILALEKVIKGAARLEQQIDVLLNINRAEAGQELTDQQPLSPLGLVADVVDLLTPRAAIQKIQLQTDLPDALPMVWGNRNMLVSTLENLVDNAIKFSPPDGVITIRAFIDVHSPGGGEIRQPTLRISVIDQGPGVPLSEHERIFQKFYQARRPEGTKGSGLGLYFCKLAVQAHGGRIWVESNGEEQGSVFSFTLPL
jgi:PAS domain S-box-containing protein